MMRYLALLILTILICLMCHTQSAVLGSDTYATSYAESYGTATSSFEFQLTSKQLFAISSDSADLANSANSEDSADLSDLTVRIDVADTAGSTNPTSSPDFADEEIILTDTPMSSSAFEQPVVTAYSSIILTEMPPRYSSREDEIVLSFAGDCTIGTDDKFDYIYSFPYRFDKVDNDFSYFFRGVRQVFENDDLTLVNLETTFTEAAKRAEKKFCFKGLPSYAKILSEGSIEMVNLSNNHIYDYFETGFRDTLQALDSENIKYCGEGEIVYFEAKGATVACLGYTGWNTTFMNEIKNDLCLARENADIVVVSFHWGSEYSFYPNAIQKKLARLCIDNGADVVVGHHPHVMQGIERYKDRVIAYSLGNFCFGGNRNPKDKDTFILQAIFPFKDGKADRSEIAILPCSLSSVSWINDYQPTILEGDKSENVLKRLLKYSSELEWGIDQSDIITR